MRDRITVLLAISLVATLVLGCSMLGSNNNNNNSSSGGAGKGKGLTSTKVCALLSDPMFENRSEFNGSSCSGSSHFGAPDTRGGPSDTDMRPSYSFAATGSADAITKVSLSMSRRDDGTARQFFLTQATAVAKMIDDQPLPADFENAITGPLSTLDPRFSKTWKIGAATVELTRTAADSTTYLTFAL